MARAAVWWSLCSLLAGPGAALQECTSDVTSLPMAAPGQKGIALDDTTYQLCAWEIPHIWPNTQEQVTSIRLYKSWGQNWPPEQMGPAMDGIVNFVRETGAKVLVSSQLSCKEDLDDRAWEWTKQLLQKLPKEQVMGLAIGNEMELLHFQIDGNTVTEECVQSVWVGGYIWRQFQRIVAEFDAMGFQNTPITSAVSGLALFGSTGLGIDGPAYFLEKPDRALVNSFFKNASTVYGARFVFTVNLYSYFEPSMQLDAGSDQCTGALANANCWEASCWVPNRVHIIRQKMERLLGHPDGVLWIGETGWSFPKADSLDKISPLKACEDWNSMKSFQNFYRNFLTWNMDAGADVKPADHVFYFTVHDSANFGMVEHLGLMGNCGEQTCKIQAADLDPPIAGAPLAGAAPGQPQGGPPPQACCRAMTAECLACADGVSTEEFCMQKPETVGCEAPQPAFGAPFAGAQPQAAAGGTRLQQLMTKFSGPGSLVVVVVTLLVLVCAVAAVVLLLCGQRQPVAPYPAVPYGHQPHAGGQFSPSRAHPGGMSRAPLMY